MKKRPEKQKDMEQLRDKLAENGSVFLTGYEKMTVQEDFELRKAIRAVESLAPGRNSRSASR